MKLLILAVCVGIGCGFPVELQSPEFEVPKETFGTFQRRLL